MRVISVISLKGGVAKTTTSVNMAFELNRRGYKVLLIDNDKQGNASKAFDLYNPDDKKTIARVMGERVQGDDIAWIIKNTKYEGLDIITANMDLQTANWRALVDASRQQQTRFKKALEKVGTYYDFCVIDNAPDINMSIINALVITDDVIAPIVIDKYSFDGLDILEEQIADIKEDYNEKIQFAGCLVTQYQRNEVNEQGEEVLRNRKKTFVQHIRRTDKKPQESTFAMVPLIEYSVRCGASQDYKKFVSEYLENVPDLGTKDKEA